jgi:hypothetical protein
LPESRFQKDFLDMLSEFLAAGVEFLLVGGHALGRHGYVRATDDLDLWVRSSPENAQRVWRALAAFGAPLNGLTPADFHAPELVFQIGVPPNRIDIMTSIDGVLFDAAWGRRSMLDIEDLKVPVIGRDDLILNKKSTGRKKDEADAEALEALALDRPAHRKSKPPGKPRR